MRKIMLVLMVVSAFIFFIQGSVMAEPSVIANGKTVKLHYTLTVEGKEVDSSRKGEPISFTEGQGKIIPGLEKQLLGLKVGDKREITIKPEEGYGPVDPKAFMEVSKEQLPKEGYQVGSILSSMSSTGQPIRAVVSEIKADKVVLNMNHPLAGKILNFSIEVIAIS